MPKPRWQIVLISRLDPVALERLEAHGFFYGDPEGHYVRFVGQDERETFESLLKQAGCKYQLRKAPGRGQFARYPRLSDQLVVSQGGDPHQCALCGATGVDCREWVEGDDADDLDAPGVRSFFMCGQCVQHRMEPHPRIYAPVEDDQI